MKTLQPQQRRCEVKRHLEDGLAERASAYRWKRHEIVRAQGHQPPPVPRGVLFRCT